MSAKDDIKDGLKFGPLRRAVSTKGASGDGPRRPNRVQERLLRRRFLLKARYAILHTQELQELGERLGIGVDTYRTAERIRAKMLAGHSLDSIRRMYPLDAHLPREQRRHF